MSGELNAIATNVELSFQIDTSSNFGVLTAVFAPYYLTEDLSFGNKNLP